MMREIVELVQALNLSTQKNIIGNYFPEILALLSIVFGGAFLLFGWKHHAYFLGVTGFLTGGWAGLMLKSHLQPSGGGVTPMLYLATCAVAGAFVAICWKRFVGILLGGFTVAILGSVFFPQYFKPGDHTLAAVSMAFLLGGGLGAIFPKFFFVFNSSLIGAVFVTYGISGAVVGKLVSDVRPETHALVHLCVFLPALVFGVMYQLTTSAHEAMPDDAPPRAARVGA
jgi:uncharacterized protein DUF4203